MMSSPFPDAIPVRRTTTDVRDLLGWSLTMLESQAKAFDIALRVRVDEDVPAQLSLDRNKIAWVITALIGSALRYVRRGSTTMPGGSIVVHASYDAAEDRVSIAVQDDGPGIAANQLSSMLDDSTNGNSAALGLAMVRDVVVAHGGTVSIESETGGFAHGTTVRFTLPVGESPAPSGAVRNSTSEPAA
jgi:two-component system, OmpR family, sensor histidine kinase VicK